MCSHKLIFPQSLGKCINIDTNIDHPNIVYLRRCVTGLFFLAQTSDTDISMCQ